MLQSVNQRKRGEWAEIQTIGSGGFGTVILWQHERTGEHIAVKKCRLQRDMQARHKRRWELEVDIMKRLNHPNVVSARDVPEPLIVDKEELPLLAMEYCAGGDLRKALNLPGNCCGLREYSVRCIVQDISSAIEYLHSKRIIHRDLKPENIVLQDGEERIIYKLIDLGYAKELDQGSVCTSFVGTLQYLAPELFASRTYSRTADYWSFGTVVFECIVGHRPFLPSAAPVQWHRDVCRKTSEDIRAYQDAGGDVIFSKKLPAPNHLSRTLQAFFEQWLRLMVRWDPKVRGGGVNDTNRPKCFALLESILSMKIVHVLHVPTNQLLSYPVMEDHTLLKLQEIIAHEKKILVEDQVILLASGSSPDPQQNAVVQCWSKPSKDDWVVFLYHKPKVDDNDGQEAGSMGDADGYPEPGVDPRCYKPLPPVVEGLVREPTTLLGYQEQRRAWGEAVYFCQEQERDLSRLFLSQRAAMLSLIRLHTDFLKVKGQMVQNTAELQAKTSYFMESLQHDMQHYNDQASNGGITSDSMFVKWQTMVDEIAMFSEVIQRVEDMERQSHVRQASIVELQKSPFSRSKQMGMLGDIATEAQNLYLELRQTPKEQRHLVADHTRMVQIITKCVGMRNKSLAELYPHLRKICRCKAALEKQLPGIELCSTDILAASEKLMIFQKQRQNDLWFLVKVALRGPANGGLESQGFDLTANTANNGSSVSGQSTRAEHNQLIEDNREARLRLEELFSTVIEQSDECLHTLQSLDWEFLDIDDSSTSTLHTPTT